MYMYLYMYLSPTHNDKYMRKLDYQLIFTSNLHFR